MDAPDILGFTHRLQLDRELMALPEAERDRVVAEVRQASASTYNMLPAGELTAGDSQNSITTDDGLTVREKWSLAATPVANALSIADAKRMTVLAKAAAKLQSAPHAGDPIPANRHPERRLPATLYHYGPGGARGPASPAPRNSPCPCGSGKKFKRCHGAPPIPEPPPASGEPPAANLEGQHAAVAEPQAA